MRAISCNDVKRNKRQESYGPKEGTKIFELYFSLLQGNTVTYQDFKHLFKEQSYFRKAIEYLMDYYSMVISKPSYKEYKLDYFLKDNVKYCNEVVLKHFQKEIV